MSLDSLGKSRGFVGRCFSQASKKITEHAESVLNWENVRADQVKWIESHRWINGNPWSYSSSGPFIEYGDTDRQYDILPRPYLIPFLQDTCKIKSIEKCRQSELTENHINESLWWGATRPATKIVHVFPTDSLARDVSNEKIQVAAEESPEIYKLIKAISVRRLKFKNNSIYAMAGATSKYGGRATSRDIIIFDEVDLIAEEAFGVFERLLEHSALQLIRYISTPTVPNIGIDARVQKGCGNHWQIKCPKCKRRQFFKFPENIINFFDVSTYDPESPEYRKRLNKVYIGCRFCKHYIDRCSKGYAATSRWVPAKSSLVDIHNSYYLPMFLIPWKTGREMLRKYHELSDYIFQFMNEVIGCAYVKSGSQLSVDDMRKNCRPWKMMVGRTSSMQCVSAGIDWGLKQSWIVISATGVEASAPHKRCIVYVEEINEQVLKACGFKGLSNEHELRAAQIIDAFSCDLIINDANGLGADRNTYLINRYPKRAWGAFFDTAEMKKQITQSKLLVPNWNAAARKVTFSKLNVWKEIQSEYRRGLCLLPHMDGDRDSILQKFIEHHLALVTQPTWNTEYQREYEKVVKVEINDHLADADQYSAIGCWKLMGGRSGRIPGIG